MTRNQAHRKGENRALLSNSLGPTDSEGGLRRFWAHATILATVLIVLTPLVGGTTITIPDEAVYSAQARNISQGSWSSSRPAADLDPIGEYEALRSTNVLEDRAIPYSRHITYPILLAPFYTIGGQHGLVLLSVMGLWSAAVCGAVLTRVVYPKAGPIALWSIGLASPLVFYGFTATAHSLVAAFIGLACIGSFFLTTTRRFIHLLYALPSVGLAVLVRSEGAVVAVALGIGLVISSIGLPRFRRLDWRAFTAGMLVIGVAGAAYLLDNRLVRFITGADSPRADPTILVMGKQAGPGNAAWVSLFRPFDGDGLNAQPTIVLAIVAILLSAVILRILPRKPSLPLALTGLSAIAAVTAVVLGAPGFITGFFAAYPLVLAGLIQLPIKKLQHPLVQILLVTSILSVAGLLLTIYAIGGASEWGGRFFQVLIPILVPLASAGWHESISPFQPKVRRLIVLSLAVTSLSFTVVSLTLARDMRDGYATWVARTTELAEETHVGGREHPLVVVTGISATGRSRYFWDVYDRVDVLSVNAPSMSKLLRVATEHDIKSMIITGPILPRQFSVNFNEPLKHSVWTLDTTHNEIGAFWAYRLTRG